VNTKKIPIFNFDPVCSYKESHKYASKYATSKDYSVLINSDCDAYKENGEPLFFYRKNRLPAEICKTAYKNLRKAATATENRGMAAGPLDTEEHLKHKQASRTRFQRIKPDGSLSRVFRSKKVKSGIAGYFDRNARRPYCRQTAFTEHNRKEFVASVPYLRGINSLFAEACPDRYKAQAAYAEKTNKDFIISGTVFTTVTVNRNFQTAYHLDAGDLKAGLGNIAVLKAGKYEGGYTVMPRYDCAFDLGSGDVCFFDVHEYHGNTEIIAKAPYERISIVCYYRENMADCGSMTEELGRAKHRKTGDTLGRKSSVPE
tara:strand:- start:552 stop:1496 length:945 start_codon:yes stop_codon:yes gene_type:complete